ncbi:3-methyl-2-oxobutanoate hydroxymethyltransferase [Aquibacillus albus]|uniref:3-methyl-2-oxobutanoate hydroxymethyltransferase n=1 Tax=Aquibacillus albus TaxID=1168171 RepID=A0ABS2MVX9_9BACI|nr:3-methyl-2-oxobutanoate hydroxymethyltransferase [Aquibacillus albus]MBM7569850.1 3-methyl-2-oxobutanoate hydroxymethyltransferase [Aquibacillus albus]
MKNRMDFLKMKDNGEKITMVTAYDYPSAKMSEQANIDMILVGDSLGMVVLGYDSTIKVTMDDMIHHAKAVKRGATNTFIVVDMPFMSYHVSLADSLYNAKRLFQETSANALKIEGASEEVLTLTSRLTAAGIPVVAHIGLTPQSVNVLGGYRIQGKDKETAEQLIREAKAIQNSGAIALVLECVPMELAQIITNELDIPTIGIGAGNHCDGQVLVYHDVVNYGVDRLPKFVKAYTDINNSIVNGLQVYVNEVKEGTFPDESHSFSMSPNVLSEIKLGD